MLFRSMTIAALVLTISQPACAADIYTLPDAKLSAAARHLRDQEFGSVRDDLKDAPKNGIGEFLLGMAAFRQQDWENAAAHLAASPDAFPLLGDYALFHEASSLFRLARLSDALLPLQRLAKDFPGSPLTRSARILTADILYDSGDFSGARSAYQKFIETYPSGNDALSATYRSALCLERLGDMQGAAVSLRTIWLKYPSSSIATRAEDDLRRLASAGARVEPYNTAELLQRGQTLYDLGKYSQAAHIFTNFSSAQQPTGSADRYLLKRGQALFKARRYLDATEALSSLLTRTTDVQVADEARLWLARAQNRNGKEEEAFSTYLKLVETAAHPDMADRALLEASYIRKHQQRPVESVALLSKLLEAHPASPLRLGAIWEIAWGCYLNGDMKTAAAYFKPLTDESATREKALYWYGRALASSGDADGSKSAFSALLTDFPYGFYAQSYQAEAKFPAAVIAMPPTDLCELLPLPSGFERVKALITFGMYGEARRELTSAGKKATVKNGQLPGLARLYLEMSDYNGAYNLLRNARPVTMDKDNLYQWGLCFPRAYREHVSSLAAKYSVPEGLIYAVIRAESSFSPVAVSPVGAVGLMQLMPKTAAALAKDGKDGATNDKLTNPALNIDYGVRHLRDLLKVYDNDPVLAVAAYNAGAGNVNRWRKAFGTLPRNEFIESIPFAETREYVKKVISGAELYDRLYRLEKPSGPATTPSQQLLTPMS